MLLIIFALLAFRRCVFGRRGAVTLGHSIFSQKNKKKKKKRKKTGSGQSSAAGSCAGGGLDPSPLDDIENQIGRDTSHDEFVLTYAVSATIRHDVRTSTGSRAKRGKKAVVFDLSSFPGADGGGDVEAGGANACLLYTSPSPRD